MGDYEKSQDVDAPAQQLFDYLSDVRNLPKYFDSMTSAEPADGETVHTTAHVDGREVAGEARFKVDPDTMHLAWGSEGGRGYRGHLDVTGDEAGSTVTVGLHTEQVERPEIGEGLATTLTNIKRLVETDSAATS